MILVLGERVPRNTSVYEIVMFYSNRDDEILENHAMYTKYEDAIKMAKVLEKATNDLEFANGEKFPDTIPNFTELFYFQNADEKFDNGEYEEWSIKVYGEDYDFNDDKLLWDYTTCSGEIPLTITRYEIYWYDIDGIKYHVSLEEDTE